MLPSSVVRPDSRAGKAEVCWALAKTLSSATLTSRASLQKGLACSSRSTRVSASAGIQGVTCMTATSEPKVYSGQGVRILAA